METPPLGCVSGHTYPSGLLVDGPPRRPLGIGSPPRAPKSAKSAFGAPRPPQNVVHVCKSATWAIWERQGAPKCSKRNFAVLTSQNSKIPRTRMPKRESDFFELFYFFENCKKSSLFCRCVREGILPMVADYFFGPNAPSRSSGTISPLGAPR